MWSAPSGLLGIYVPVVRANPRNKQKTQYDIYMDRSKGKTHAREGDRKGLMELTSEQRWTGSEASATRRAGGTAFQAEGRASVGAWWSPSAAVRTNSKASSCPERAARGKRQRSWGDDHVTTRTLFFTWRVTGTAWKGYGKSRNRTRLGFSIGTLDAGGRVGAGGCASWHCGQGVCVGTVETHIGCCLLMRG